MGHHAMLTRMKGFQEMIAAMVLRISKSITFVGIPPKSISKINKRYKKINRPGSRYEAATHRLLGITLN